MESPKQLPETSQVQIAPSHAAQPDLYRPSYPGPLGPEVQEEDDPFGKLVEYWDILRRHKFLVFLATFIGALAGLGVTLWQEPMYQARTTMEIQSAQEGLSRVSLIGSGDVHMQTQIDILKSRTLLDRVMSKMKQGNSLKLQAPQDLLAPWRKALGLNSTTGLEAWQKALGIARGTLKITATKESDIIVLQCESTDPKVAAGFLDMLTKQYIEQQLEERWNTYQNTGDWLNQAQAELKAKLEASEGEVQRFARTSGLLIISETQNVAEDKLRQLQSELSTALGLRITKQAKYEQTISNRPEALPEVLDNGPMGTYQVQLTELRRQLAELSSALTPEHYKIKRLQAQISELESTLQRERNNIIKRIRSEYEAALRTENQIRSEYDRQVKLLSGQADDLIHFRILKREADTNRQLYEIALQKGKEASIDSALRASNARVVDVAKTPEMPYKPILALDIALGLAGGFLFGSVFVVVCERLRAVVRIPSYLPMQLSVRELGVIPSAAIDGKAYPSAKIRKTSGLSKRAISTGGRILFNPDFKESRNGQLPDSLELVTWNRKPSVMAEAFRATMASILFSAHNQSGAHVIVFTSPSPGEGKTTTTCNISIALAEINRRVLLIDGDMRVPRLHSIFSVANTWGLSDLLQERTPIEEYSIERLARTTDIPGLFVLPSGTARSNLSTLLHSSRLREVLARYRREFEVILIDAPPVLYVPDARMLARAADSVIIVFRMSSTTRDAATAAVRCFDEDGTPILGTILNDSNPNNAGYGSYRSAYSYYGPYGAHKS